MTINPRKIDIHCHTTKRKLYNAPVLDGDVFIKPAIFSWMETEKIEKTVLLASYFPHRGSGISNFRLARWIDDYDPEHKELLMFGSLDCNHYEKQGLSELEELAESGMIKGIKVYMGYQDITTRHLMNIGWVADKFRLPVMFHTGYVHINDNRNTERAVHPEEVLPFIERWPYNPVILSHLGNPYFDDVRRIVKKYPRVFSDVSGLMDSSDREQQGDIPKYAEEVSKFLQECGPSKLLYGSDFPVQHYSDTKEILGKGMSLAGISDSDRELILYGNAAKLLGINKEKEEPIHAFGSAYD